MLTAQPPSESAVKPPLQRLRLAVTGNPNSGKTTLFNRLTGLRQKVANYSGVTIEKKTGFVALDGGEVELVDLPGIYGLSPASEEERIAAEVITGRHQDSAPVHGVLCVLDSTCLERSLYLVLQILETGIPMAVLLNMSDELLLRGAAIDAPQLSRLLGVPVLQISATQQTGLADLYTLLENWIGRIREPFVKQPVLRLSPVDVARRRIQAKQLCRSVITKDLQPHPWSDRIDDLVMHKVWGSLIFAAVVLIVFQAIFTGAQPIMNWIDSGFTALGQVARTHLPAGLWASFIADGVIAGVGSVVVFLPQILIVFFFIAILEHSGYLARAAVVMDKVMSRIGLQGKSFLPLISSYACAVPGIMAARTIENKRDRLATIFIAPFMTCSARLPVYALLIGAFIPNKPVIPGLLGLQAVTLLSLYAAGFFAALATAWVLKSSVLKSDGTPFFMEIPPYRWPMLKTILLMMWERAKVFLQRAGTVILGASIALWFLASFPRHQGPDALEQSFAGHIGHWIEPAVKPLGWNWKIGVGLLSAQAAREVIISSLSTLYRVEDRHDGNMQSLQNALRVDLTPLSAAAMLIFFAFAMQCASTLAVVRRETGTWTMPALMFLYMNALAYVAALIVYQGGRFFGFQ